jgi:hypothetical protein
MRKDIAKADARASGSTCVIKMLTVDPCMEFTIFLNFSTTVVEILMVSLPFFLFFKRLSKNRVS